MDYLGTLQDVEYGAHGYASYFVSSVIGTMYKPNLEVAEAVEILKYCVKELRTRFLISQDNFILKLIDKNGITII